MVTMSEETSATALAVFNTLAYRKRDLAKAGIAIDKISWTDLPKDLGNLHEVVSQKLDFEDIAHLDTQLVGLSELF
jgi:hypothetical protein